MINIPSTHDLAEALVSNEGADPEFAELAAGMILDGIIIRINGQTTQSIRELVDNHKAALPSFYIAKSPAAQAQEEPEPSPSRELTLTEKIAAEHRKAATSLDGPNPWSRATWNVTRQVALEAKDPSRAATMKANAR